MPHSRVITVQPFSLKERGSRAMILILKMIAPIFHPCTFL